MPAMRSRRSASHLRWKLALSDSQQPEATCKRTNPTRARHPVDVPNGCIPCLYQLARLTDLTLPAPRAEGGRLVHEEDGPLVKEAQRRERKMLNWARRM